MRNRLEAYQHSVRARVPKNGVSGALARIARKRPICSICLFANLSGSSTPTRVRHGK